jgi:hypothetical protein
MLAKLSVLKNRMVHQNGLGASINKSGNARHDSGISNEIIHQDWQFFENCQS